MTSLDTFRKEKDEAFALSAESPLAEKQKKGFTGLKYFPENSALRFVAKLEESQDHAVAVLRTSTAGTEEYVHAGQFRFTVDDVEVVLQAYQDDHGYFIPFIDATSPSESYGAGRYLNAHGHGDGTIHVDFNYAYNPFCAYNESWSCPLPPNQNRILVRIEAGEKKFHD
ncbi:MAG: hypothetical protein CVV51_00280 [Spirochaetae bacterium HGW-Spirochaetae-7]|jgi:hypothetical protein|nr:MAG: hypothetical protein CVV51_00280 [Spirochaetae bacterium HGW-Spirochaetae-7]